MVRKAIPWISEKQVESAVRLETVLVLISLSLIAWVVYKVFLRRTSRERHAMLMSLFKNLFGHLVLSLLLYACYEVIEWTSYEPWSVRLLAYVGFATVVWGWVVFIKTLRILAFEYLFIVNMRSRVPLLLVNIFTLVISVFALGWVLTTIFDVRLTPLLATSAILSIVLGLALQDTLGNLFAGIALQFDKPFEMGDWIEIKTDSEKISGQVLEVSWRATSLIAITDEVITLPNRSIAQYQISNFAGRERPFLSTLR